MIMNGLNNETELSEFVFTDFHTHILPDLDDGAQHVKTAAGMIYEERCQADRLFGEKADCILLATPHYRSYEEDVENFLSRRQKSFDTLSEFVKTSEYERLRKAAERVTLLTGAEIMVHSELEKAKNLDKLFLGKSRRLLFEFSEDYFSSSYIQIIERICYKYDALPIIAHFERYASFMQKEDYEALTDLHGVIFQFNALNFNANGEGIICRNFLSPSAKFILKFMGEGTNMIMGSDCHGIQHRKPDCEKSYKAAKKFMKPDVFEKFMSFSRQTAQEILMGK